MTRPTRQEDLPDATENPAAGQPAQASDASAAPRYSVVVPCFNESESLPRLAERLARLEERLESLGTMEVILVDDGSDDDTSEAAERLFADSRFFRCIRHQQNVGIGAAFATGIGWARGSVIATIDADCTYDPLLLESLILRLENGADVVTSSPYHPDGEVENVGALRLFLSRGLSRCYSLVLGGRLYTYTACFRAYREETARRCMPWSNGFVGVAEMLCLALLQGYRVEEVPARLESRRHGESKMRVGGEIVRHLKNLLFILLRRGPYERFPRG